MVLTKSTVLLSLDQAYHKSFGPPRILQLILPLQKLLIAVAYCLDIIAEFDLPAFVEAENLAAHSPHLLDGMGASVVVTPAELPARIAVLTSQIYIPYTHRRAKDR